MHPGPTVTLCSLGSSHMGHPNPQTQACCLLRAFAQAIIPSAWNTGPWLAIQAFAQVASMAV